jgi:hypothetical protein
MFTGVVSTEIVIIPSGQNARSRIELLILGFGREAFVFGPQRIHVVGIAVNIIAQKNEQIGIIGSGQR